MEHGINLLRDLEKLCKNDIRYMYLLDDMPTPSHATFGNFIRNELTTTIEQIFHDINAYIFEVDHVELEQTYIDGTKIEANANRYTWVWKNSCIKNRSKVFEKLSSLIDSMNTEVLGFIGVKLEKRDEYAIKYVEETLENYQENNKARRINLCFWNRSSKKYSPEAISRNAKISRASQNICQVYSGLWRLKKQLCKDKS